MLVEARADINRQLETDIYTLGSIFITLWVLSLLCGNEEITSYLLKKGAGWNATTVISGKPDVCSIK